MPCIAFNIQNDFYDPINKFLPKNSSNVYNSLIDSIKDLDTKKEDTQIIEYAKKVTNCKQYNNTNNIGINKLSLFQFEKEFTNFFEPNCNLVIYNLNCLQNIDEVVRFCIHFANFEPPMELGYNEESFLGLAKLKFANIKACKKAYTNINDIVGSPIFAQYGVPEHLDYKIDKKIQNSINTKKIIDVNRINVKNSIPCFKFLIEKNFYKFIHLNIYLNSPSSILIFNIIFMQIILEKKELIVSDQNHIIRNFFIKNYIKMVSLYFLDSRSVRLANYSLTNKLLERNSYINFKPKFIVDTNQIKTNCPIISKCISNMDKRVLTVSSKTQVKAIAGAIAHTVRKCQCPIILAGGPEGVNLTLKAIAIAREYLEEDTTDIFCFCEKSNNIGGYRFTVIKKKFDHNNCKKVNEGIMLSNSDMKNLIKVSKHSKLVKVTNAVVEAIHSKKKATIGSMGPGSVFQAIKVVIAVRQCLNFNKCDLEIQPEFISMQIGNNGTQKRSVLRINIRVFMN